MAATVGILSSEATSWAGFWGEQQVLELRGNVRREYRDGGRTDRGKDRSEGGEHGVTRIRWLVGGQKAGSSDRGGGVRL